MQFVDLHELNANESATARSAAAVDARASKFAHATPVASSWSDLGRLVRTAAMAAVTEHFASLATEHDEFRPSLGRGPSPSPSQGEGGKVPLLLQQCEVVSTGVVAHPDGPHSGPYAFEQHNDCDEVPR